LDQQSFSRLVLPRLLRRVETEVASKKKAPLLAGLLASESTTSSSYLGAAIKSGNVALSL
jgi:hypothetical protein